MLAEVHCNCQTVTLKQEARGKERITTGITSCGQFRSCWRASWVGLPACGAAHWGLLSVADPFGSRQALPFARQCQHRSLVVTR